MQLVRRTVVSSSHGHNKRSCMSFCFKHCIYPGLLLFWTGTHASTSRLTPLYMQPPVLFTVLQWNFLLRCKGRCFDCHSSKQLPDKTDALQVGTLGSVQFRWEILRKKYIHPLKEHFVKSILSKLVSSFVKLVWLTSITPCHTTVKWRINANVSQSCHILSYSHKSLQHHGTPLL